MTTFSFLPTRSSSFLRSTLTVTKFTLILSANSLFVQKCQKMTRAVAKKSVHEKPVSGCGSCDPVLPTVFPLLTCIISAFLLASVETRKVFDQAIGDGLRQSGVDPGTTDPVPVDFALFTPDIRSIDSISDMPTLRSITFLIVLVMCVGKRNLFINKMFFFFISKE